jgi:hypothetical protein
MRFAARSIGAVAISLAACAPDQQSASPAEHSSAASAAAAQPLPVDSNVALSANGGGCFAPLITASQTDLTTLIDVINPEWAPVLKGANPMSDPVLVHGTAVESHVSKEDFPAAHVTFDQNTELTLDDADVRFLASGNTDHKLELEWETGSYPAWAWPGIGDRVVALGRWIFDCGHPDPSRPGLCSGTTSSFCLTSADCVGGAACDGAVFNYRSEMHPPQAVAVIRSGGGGRLHEEDGDGRAVPVTRADAFVSADGGGAGDACVVTHRPSAQAVLFGPSCFPLRAPLAPLNARDFTFEVPLPQVRRGRQPTLRFVSHSPVPSVAGLPPVAARYKAQFRGAPEPRFEVTVAMTEPVHGALPTGFAGTFFAGWRNAPRSRLEHVRVTLDSVIVQNALKTPVPGLAPIDTPPGWKMQVNVNGDWQEIPGLEQVSVPGTFRVAAVFDRILARDATLQIHADASSATCVDTLFAHSLLEDLIRFGFTGNLADGSLGTALAKGQLCLADRKELDAGEAEIEFVGPNFGARAAPYEITSQGENGPAYKLRFRIDRVEQDDD